MNTKRQGFTLIELLVVLAVLAALAAILFPVFASVRHRTRITDCASNLHQISLALHQYAAESDGIYPPNNNFLGNEPQLVWKLLTPYTQNAEVFHCPDERYGPAAQAGALSNGYGYRTRYVSRAVLQKPPRPGSNTVVAYCPHHWSDNFVMVLRENGAVDQVPRSQIQEWVCHTGYWYPRGRFPLQVGDLYEWRFPGEEWPPEFQP